MFDRWALLVYLMFCSVHMTNSLSLENTSENSPDSWANLSFSTRDLLAVPGTRYTFPLLEWLMSVAVCTFSTVQLNQSGLTTCPSRSKFSSLVPNTSLFTAGVPHKVYGSLLLINVLRAVNGLFRVKHFCWSQHVPCKERLDTCRYHYGPP